MTQDRYLAIHNLSLLQRQAGVEPDVAELVKSFGQLLVDSGKELEFDRLPFTEGSPEQQRFLFLQNKNPDVDSRFLAMLAAYSERMAERGYAPVVSRENLAELLGYDLQHLLSIAAKNSRFYRAIELRRKNGSFRRVYSPREPIRSIQSWILKNILNAYRPHEAAHGFCRNRSIVSNAAQHAGNSVLIALDIADFFPSITQQKVRKAFEKLGYTYSVAMVLANLCTRSGFLPQGAPTSPALSNLVCENLDRRLSGLARSRGFTYSRYADDMAFSSNDGRLNTLIPFLREIIQQEGFQVRPEKTRISRGSGRMMVTGVVVNDRPNLPRSHVRKLRAAVHRLKQNGPEAVILESRRTKDADVRNVLAGHLGFLAMVNPAGGKRLALALRSEKTSSTLESG